MVSIAQGIKKATSMKNSGMLDLKLKINSNNILGKVEALGNITNKKISLSAYASAWGGMKKNHNIWSKNWGAEIGIKGVF